MTIGWIVAFERFYMPKSLEKSFYFAGVPQKIVYKEDNMQVWLVRRNNQNYFLVLLGLQENHEVHKITHFVFMDKRASGYVLVPKVVELNPLIQAAPTPTFNVSCAEFMLLRMALQSLKNPAQKFYKKTDYHIKGKIPLSRKSSAREPKDPSTEAEIYQGKSTRIKKIFKERQEGFKFGKFRDWN